ncbi:PAS domain-containing sensor histidine kinase [Evansella tamaricis]|uniref:PAS domain S-box protein n=1 Tax=Evansella tamaricis TaxID=2069301 RepID=A0ABS6JC24_9BACI|nr:PAS domain-containing sensor histidine kinase [Evansella tamaricis]MBU9711216.1 PAS domain S-box protein [Evansella tamaricis]
MDERIEYEILDRISDAFFAVDGDWKITYFNQEAAKVLGRAKEEVIHQNLWEKFPEAVGKEVYHQYHKAVREQVPVFFEMYWFPRKMWYSVRAYPSENGLSVYFQDITNQKRLASKQEEHYKSLFHQNPVAVFSFDLDGNYLSVNPAMEELLGYKEAEYLSMSFIPLVTDAEIEKVKGFFMQAAEGKTQHYETEALHKDGHVVLVKVTNMPIIVENKIVGVYGMARDVTKEKKTEKLLFESEKLTAVGQLAASIAHEIRNPLTTIKGFLQLIKNSNGETKEEYYSILSDEVTRIELITGELLVLAKPQAQDFQQVNIGKMLEDVITLFSPQALMQHVEIHCEIPEIPFVNCIENQLKQAIINVVKNAIESMPQGGNIHIKVKAMDGSVHIMVRDQGCGIPKEFLDKIGSPFYTTKEKGTGLGMMTTLKIVQTHNGTLEIASKSNQGTTVKITLPIS